MTRICLLLFTLLFTALNLSAQKDKKEHPENPFSDTLAVRSHTAQIEGKTLRYQTRTGYTILKDELGKPRANVFHIDYIKSGVSDVAQRPVLFSFNGGPGSSSVWLHLGVFGPQRIAMDSMGRALGPPYRLENNPYSWLDETDLVFIDPMMTGLTRPAPGVDKKEFTGLENDIKLVGTFIQRWLTENGRWASPKILAGESYGTTRAAGLAAYLQGQHGIYLNGIVLVSAILDFSTARFNVGNDLPYPLFLPTYTATAYYHGKLPADLQARPLEDVLAEVEQFAQTEYAAALFLGDQLDKTRANEITKKLSRYTGLDEDFVRQTNMRPVIHDFTKELRRDERTTVGRLDSRFAGRDRTAQGQRYEADPSYDAILGSFSGTLNDYLSRSLGYRPEIKYEILTGRVRPWSYATFENSYVNVAERLRRAIHMNPNLQVWVANGYYDLATPYFATKYTFDHMQLAPEYKANIMQTYYPAGHMMYIQDKSNAQMHRDFERFMQRIGNN